MSPDGFRVSFRGPVTLTDRDGGAPVHAEARDLSRGGMFVTARSTLQAGAAVSIRLPAPDGSWFETKATVVRTVTGETGNEDRGFALRFDDLGTLELARIDTLAKLAYADATVARERLKKLIAVTERITAGMNSHEILDRVYDSFREMIPFDRMGLSLLREDGRKVESVWARSEVPIRALPVGYAALMDGSSLEVIVRSGKPRILNDLETYLELHPESVSTRRIVEDGMRASLTCPVIAAGRPIGFVFFSSKETQSYSPLHVETFVDLAQQVSLAVERGLLFDDMLDAYTKLASANKKLRRLMHIDRLTRVRNRRYFDHRLDVEWRRAKRHHGWLSLILIDIDHFKAYNDSHGHPAGDLVLSSIARALKQSLHRPDEFVARYGGEEFAALLPQTGSSAAVRTARILEQAVRELKIPHGSSVTPFVTISLGVASVRPSREGNYGELVEAADRELYRAKDAGRNQVAVRRGAHRPQG